MDLPTFHSLPWWKCTSRHGILSCHGRVSCRSFPLPSRCQGIAIVVCKVKMCDTAVERSVYHSFHVLKIVFRLKFCQKPKDNAESLSPLFSTAVVYHFVISFIVRYKHFKKTSYIIVLVHKLSHLLFMIIAYCIIYVNVL